MTDGAAKFTERLLAEHRNIIPQAQPATFQASQPNNGHGTPKGRKRTGQDLPEFENQERGWAVHQGQPFITAKYMTGGVMEYRFLSYNRDTGEISGYLGWSIKSPERKGDKIISSGVMIIPRSLPKDKQGVDVEIVGLPDVRAVLDAPDLSPAEITSLMVTHITKYCDMSSSDMDLAKFYIWMTWYYHSLNTVGYYRLRADTGKGKTRFTSGVGDLCFLPVRAAGASSSSGIMRFQESWRGTLIMDEGDIAGERDDSGGYTNPLLKYLNLGFERGQYYIKTDKIDPKLQEIFDPFCPKIIAMRGTFQDVATEGRCLSVSPPETNRKDIPPVLPACYYKEVETLRAIICRYVLKHWDAVSSAAADPDLSDVQVEPRLKQLGVPLLKVISKILPDGETQFRHYLTQRQKEIKTDRAQSFTGMLVNAVYERTTDPANIGGYVTSKDISDALGLQQQTKITKTLKDAGFSTVKQGIIYNEKYFDKEANTEKTREKRKTIRRFIVESVQRWHEIDRRYIVAEREKEQAGLDNYAEQLTTLPEGLKSPELLKGTV